MMANIFLNPELDPETLPPTIPERMAQIEVMGLEFDGNNPKEPGGWIETEDIADETTIEDMVDPNLQLYNPQFGLLCNDLVGLSRKEQLDYYFHGVDGIRSALWNIESRETLYALVTLATDLDAAMLAVNQWDKGFDTFARLEREFEDAERQVKRLEDIQVEQERIDAYAATYWLHQEAMTDHQRVSA